MSKILEWMDQLEALTSERDALRSENEQLKMEKKELGNMSQILVQKEWYYIWKPLNESEIFARNIKVGATLFIQQMLRWMCRPILTT